MTIALVGAALPLCLLQAAPATAADSGFVLKVKERKEKIVGIAKNEADYQWGWYMTLERKQSGEWKLVEDSGLESGESRKLKTKSQRGRWRVCVEIDTGKDCSKPVKV
ncbi:hypothetical protein [uncultured Nocardioides sp.]|uniref:hypothetical protein n=1 Tax=uncultured Nocardioides sp. TaxID=198441 RepID=UPI000C6152DB|nr:hypothetical protein [Nocardioides sp.]|tara:strand:- start:1760 stop:2083 length:324 start_codon:yes stop_codon:yes gene_type:complete